MGDLISCSQRKSVCISEAPSRCLGQILRSAREVFKAKALRLETLLKVAQELSGIISIKFSGKSFAILCERDWPETE